MNVAGPACAEVRKAAVDFVHFLNKAVTPFHAVEECSQMLREAGFRELKETEHWKVEPLQKYFVTKNRSAIMAFAVGGAYKSGNGFSIVVGHTDSPCLRVKPVSTLKSERFLQVGVSTYGGGLWRTWFDRDLSLAGQVVVNQNNSIVRKLINVEKPVLFIPNLAIHLESDRTKFECNNEVNLRPIIASYAAVELNKCDDKKCEADEVDPRKIVKDHHPVLLELIAKHASCKPEDIIDMDLYLYDAQPAVIAGVKEEFISGARLDNLVGTYTAVRGLIESVEGDATFESDTNIRIAACYDNEECGSQSAQGAESAFTEWVLRRLAAANHDSSNPVAFEEAIGKSYLISADQAHACHPNYAAKHEENHRPAFHGGVVVKINHNQRYATTGLTHAILKQIAHTAQVPLQKVVVRNDSPCGSTVGPILSSGLGLQTIDVGCASLAMHSIREFGETTGIFHAKKLYTTFFRQLPSVMASLQ
uniref:Aspartyl aminopeptidase n=1 Tax=Steinernema glaseri TaxID=37863 RepID=A0A1I8A2B6_9BILA